MTLFQIILSIDSIVCFNHIIWESNVTDEVREGCFKDKYGRWHKDRRAGNDRRGGRAEDNENDRRKLFRRQADREIFKEDKQEIEDALKDFAEEHDGHL